MSDGLIVLAVVVVAGAGYFLLKTRKDKEKVRTRPVDIGPRGEGRPAELSLDEFYSHLEAGLQKIGVVWRRDILFYSLEKQGERDFWKKIREVLDDAEMPLETKTRKVLGLYGGSGEYQALETLEVDKRFDALGKEGLPLSIRENARIYGVDTEGKSLMEVVRAIMVKAYRTGWASAKREIEVYVKYLQKAESEEEKERILREMASDVKGRLESLG